MRNAFQTVLITGTTSGLGRALIAHYHALGALVISVNRRACSELQEKFPGVRWEVLDIKSKSQVKALLAGLEEEGRCPDLFVLNAGINRPDNFDGLEYETFSEVLETNVFGVMTFVGAIHDLRLHGKTVAALSSTSNIVPNPSHLAYFLSKKALRDGFKCLAQKDPANSYRTVVLGPVRTNIMSGYPAPPGLQGKLLELLAVSSEAAASHCARLFEGSRVVGYYPWTSWIFYKAVRVLLDFFPSLYVGTTRQST